MARHKSSAITTTQTATSKLDIPHGILWGETIYIQTTAINSGDTWTFKAQYEAPGASAIDITATSGGVTATGMTALVLASPFGIEGATPVPTHIVATNTVDGGAQTITYVVHVMGLNHAGIVVTQDAAAAREFVVDPKNNALEDYTNLQAALTAAKALASADNPVTIRLKAGVYLVDEGLVCTEADGINLVGEGFQHTIIRGTVAAFVENEEFILLDITDSTNMCFRGIHFDARSNATPAALGASGGSTTMFLDGTDAIRFDSCFCEAVTYSVWAAAGVAGNLIEAFNSRFLATNGVRTNAETWHFFSCDLRSERDDDTQFLGTVAQTALQATGPCQIWGSHLHVEDNSTGSATQSLAGVKLNAGFSVEVLGSTIHTVVANNTDSSTRKVSNVEVASADANAAIIVAGCNLILDTPNITEITTSVGIFIITTTNNGQVHKFIGNAITADIGAGPRSGNVVSNQATGTPTIHWIGNTSSSYGWTRAAAVGGAIATFSGMGPASQAGGATLASGVSRVLLLTDTGDTAETGAVFNSGTTTVTGGSAFNTIFKPGDFVRHTGASASHNDSHWTRIRAVSATTLTLEENYRGTSATGTAKKGTQTVATQPDGSYRVSLTSTSVANETFSVTLKHASGFLITSSNGASTTTVDFVILR